METDELRRAALAALLQSEEGAPPLPDDPVIRELRIHQIQLELQSDKLRRTQQELEKSAEKFRTMFQTSPIGYLKVDASRTIVAVNQALAMMLDADPSEVTGRTLDQFIANEEIGDLHSCLDELSSSRSTAKCELTLEGASGQSKRVRLDMSLVADNCCIIAITDLSDFEQIRSAKRRLKQRLRALGQALDNPVAYFDRTLTYQFCNDAHNQWFGIDCKSPAGASVTNLIGETVYDCVARALAGHACTCQVEVSLVNRGPKLVEIRYAPHLDDDGSVIGCFEIIHDVGDKLQIEAELARKAKLRASLSQLSERQKAVFNLLMAGKANKVIAIELDLGLRTVERVRTSILECLGLETINELLIRYAGVTAEDTAANS